MFALIFHGATIYRPCCLQSNKKIIKRLVTPQIDGFRYGNTNKVAIVATCHDAMFVKARAGRLSRFSRWLR
jgi:hypothetical protein